MNLKKISGIAILLLLFASVSNAQKAEITVSFNEQFFDALLDAVFRNSGPLEFPLARSESRPDPGRGTYSFVSSRNEAAPCTESITLLRENNDVRTAVRFRDGKIYAPIAFTGNYSPPLVGCVAFSGWAETNIELEFDQQTGKVAGRAKILNVSLNGTGGIGGTIIAKMVQNSIDKKINPIGIFSLDKLSFMVPLPKSGDLRMKAVGFRHDISGAMMNVHIQYEFLDS